MVRRMVSRSVTGYLVRGIATAAISIGLFVSSAAMAASYTTSVDRKTLFLDEYVLFKLSLVNSETRLRAQGESPNVDLSVLTEDFEVGVPQASHQYNINRNRGRSSSEISVALFPRHSGKLVIPPFTLDKLQTDPVTLKVMPTPPEKVPEVFSRSGVTQSTVWDREPTLAYLDLYHRVELKDARLGGKLDTKPLQLQLSKLPQTERTITMDGMTYHVTRSTWSITPLGNQPITVYFPDIWIETRDGKKIRLPFSETKIMVKPLPENIPPLTLIGKPEISQTIPDGDFRVNDPIPWRITLSAPVDINQLPEVLPIGEVSPRLKLYMENATQKQGKSGSTEKPINTVIYSGYLIPLSAGNIKMPDIRQPYFDIQGGFVTILELKGKILAVKAAIVDAEQDGPLRPISAQPFSSVRDASTSAIWKVLSLLFALLWLTTVALWWWRRKKDSGSDTETAVSNKLYPANTPPLVAMLLEVMQTATLEQGLGIREQHYGRDEALRKLIGDLQQYYYGEHKSGDENRIRQDVEEAIKKIRITPNKCIQADPWLPQSFQRNLNRL